MMGTIWEKALTEGEVGKFSDNQRSGGRCKPGV